MAAPSFVWLFSWSTSKTLSSALTKTGKNSSWHLEVSYISQLLSYWTIFHVSNCCFCSWLVQALRHSWRLFWWQNYEISHLFSIFLPVENEFFQIPKHSTIRLFIFMILQVKFQGWQCGEPVSKPENWHTWAEWEHHPLRPRYFTSRGMRTPWWRRFAEDKPQASGTCSSQSGSPEWGASPTQGPAPRPGERGWPGSPARTVARRRVQPGASTGPGPGWGPGGPRQSVASWAQGQARAWRWWFRFREVAAEARPSHRAAAGERLPAEGPDATGGRRAAREPLPGAGRLPSPRQAPAPAEPLQTILWRQNPSVAGLAHLARTAPPVQAFDGNTHTGFQAKCAPLRTLRMPSSCAAE